MTAEEFKQFLERHGWTGYQFSRLTGLPKSVVYQYAETGITRAADRLLIAYIDQYPAALARITKKLSA